LKILGISGAFGHDSSAALVVDGEVVASCEEERFNRIKRSARHPAVNAARACMSQGGFRPEDLDVVAFGWDPSLAPNDSRLVMNRDAFLSDHRWLGSHLPPVTYVPHHLAHAASGWYTSGLEEGAVLVVDGQGEDVSSTIFAATSQGLVERVRYPVASSLGFFYAAVTRYLGFAPGAAGKVMGLAAYGKVTYDFPELDFTGDAIGISIPGAQDKVERMRWWLRHLEARFGPQGVPGSSELPPRHLRDAAASAQSALERSMGELAGLAVTETGSRSLVLSGGVALNCSANGRLRPAADVDDLFVFGPAHDGGTALGAALQVAASLGEPLVRQRRTDVFLGIEHTIHATVERATRLGLSVLEGVDVAAVAADLMQAGQVGGWYRGRSELGPRALGGRSIIAKASDVGVRDRVNRVKARELWRPLAPALTTSGAAGLQIDGRYDYMVEAVWVPPELRSQADGGLDGVLHADDSMRPLVVTERSHPFHGLLDAAESRHGAAAIINTSFNNEGEPVVETPTDALRTFTSSDMDFLVVEDTLIRKPH